MTRFKRVILIDWNYPIHWKPKKTEKKKIFGLGKKPKWSKNSWANSSIIRKFLYNINSFWKFLSFLDDTETDTVLRIKSGSMQRVQLGDLSEAQFSIALEVIIKTPGASRNELRVVLYAKLLVVYHTK